MGSSTWTVLVMLLVSVAGLLMKGSKGQMVPAVYVFGDSLVDVGNNNYLPVSLAKADFPHNGIDFPTKKPTGRFCNGKNAADWLAEKLGLPTSPPYLSLKTKSPFSSSVMAGVSFASGGAGIFNGSDQTLRQSIPMTKQVDNYQSVYQALIKQMGPSAAQAHLAKSFFAIVIGSNDIFGYSNSSARKQSIPPQQFANLMATTLKDHLKKLYVSGARKFVVAGVGPLGCSPRERLKDAKNQDCDQDHNSLATLYNQQLKAVLQDLKSEFGNDNFSYSYFDTFSMLYNMILNPISYGFREVKAACCGLGDLRAKAPCLPISSYCSDRRDHVFWDLFHPTEAATQILMDAFFDGPPGQYTLPINVKQLAAI